MELDPIWTSVVSMLCRDLAEFGMGMNVAPPIMSREEFEARQADLRRKRENERRGERYQSILSHSNLTRYANCCSIGLLSIDLGTLPSHLASPWIIVHVSPEIPENGLL